MTAAVADTDAEHGQMAFDYSRLARVSDPETSYRAAARAGAFKSKHEAKIFGYLLAHPEGATYRQIASGTQLEPVAVGRRMKGLRERAGVYADGIRDGMQIWKVKQ